MRALVLFITVYFLSFSSFGVEINIDIKTKEWKKLDFPNRFPQTFFVSNKLSPLYFETGENSSELSEFLINFKKNKLDVDIDEEDNIIIKNMMKIIFEKINSENFDKNKNYLINISVNKVFECGPCTEQKEYVSILNLDDLNVINIYLI